MSTQVVIFEFPSDGTQGQGETLWADAVVHERSDHQASPTLLPVEGRFVTDHVIQNPDILQLDMVISDTPVVSDAGEWARLAQHAQAGTTFVKEQIEVSTSRAGFISVPGSTIGTKKTKVDVHGLNQNPARTSFVFARLLGAKDDAIPMTVLTTLGVWDNCVITRLSVARQKAETGIVASVEFMRLRFVDTATGSFTVIQQRAPRAQPTTDKGKKTPDELGGSKSALAGGLDTFNAARFNLFGSR